MYYASILTAIYLVQFLFFLCFTVALDKRDFYDYTKATAFSKQQVKLTSPVPYPHWSDVGNTQIDIVSSGVARFGGFGGANTLDVLVYATKLPFSNKEIRYEQIEAPDAILKDKLTNDLVGLAPSNFTASHVTLVTWVNVPYTPTRFSTFQMVFATDGNETYVILHIDNIDHEEGLPYFPEVDLRYAYAEGTKFKRSDFLKGTSGVATRSKNTAVAAADNSNCQKAGRWCFKVTDNPITVDDTKPKTTKPPVVTSPGKSVTNSSGIGLKGAFTFTTLLLESNVLTDGKNNDELSIILTKKNADQRYATLNADMMDYIRNVYKTAANSTDVEAKILGYRMGSLIVDYSINAKASSLCNGTTGSDCLNKVKKKVEEQVGNNEINSGAITGKIDPKKIEVEDFDECSISSNCDFNAICIDYPNQLTFGCVCKEEYVGDGFPGNCTPRYATYHFTSIVMYITIVVVILSIAFVTIVFYKVHKSDDADEKKLLESKYRSKQHLPHGWHQQYGPYGYGYGDNMYQRRFAGDY